MRSGPSEDDDATAWASVAPSYNLWGVFKEAWIKDLSEGKENRKESPVCSFFAVLLRTLKA